MADYFVHDSSYVEPGASLGEGTHVWYFCHIMAGAAIGARCNLGQNVFVAATAVLGNNVKVQNNVSIYDGVILEDDVFLGPSAVLTNVINPRSHIPRKHEYQQTRIGRGATVGANATIVCGVTIGEYAFIGAGAVVTRDVPAYALVFGTPAKLRGWMCQCGVRLDFNNLKAREDCICSTCGMAYSKSNDSVQPG